MLEVTRIVSKQEKIFLWFSGEHDFLVLPHQGEFDVKIASINFDTIVCSNNIYAIKTKQEWVKGDVRYPIIGAELVHGSLCIMHELGVTVLDNFGVTRSEILLGEPAYAYTVEPSRICFKCVDGSMEDIPLSDVVDSSGS
ncbi:hypothetical protein [Maricaulis maris]|uniref:hypothetical protein n=1 Tax=Maricaulis maris TaxID=74318 RepID=UPI003B8D4B00